MGADGKERGGATSETPEISETSRVAVWSTHDHARALLPVDHAIVESTAAPRALILELAARRGSGDGSRDLFSACAILGRLLAERGASPTLASATMDGAREALRERADAPWLVTARAALFEGFAAARLELARQESAAAWEYPRCAVRLDASTLAIVAGYPGHSGADGESLANWSSRVAHAASLAGVRRVVVADALPEATSIAAARAALVDACQVAGIEVLPSLPSEAPWLQWRRSSDVR